MDALLYLAESKFEWVVVIIPDFLLDCSSTASKKSSSLSSAVRYRLLLQLSSSSPGTKFVKSSIYHQHSPGGATLLEGGRKWWTANLLNHQKSESIWDCQRPVDFMPSAANMYFLWRWRFKWAQDVFHIVFSQTISNIDFHIHEIFRIHQIGRIFDYIFWKLIPWVF